jgi:hypothetical protein
VTIPFGTSLGRHADDRRHGLRTRIDLVIHERIEQAIEAACLEVLVEARRRSGLPMPTDESAADRDEFRTLAVDLLARLEAAILPAVEPRHRTGLIEQDAGARGSHAARMATQVALAKLLPDYWQRFEACQAEFGRDPRARGDPP